MKLIGLRRFWPVALAACLGIAASLAAFDYARSAARQRLSAELWVKAETRARDLQEVLSRYEGTVEGFAAAFPYEGLTAEHFRTYAQSVFLASSMLRSGLQSLTWAPLVSDRERDAFEARDAAERGAPFTILELAPDRRMRPAARRGEYYPMQFVEPPRQGVPIGFDILSEPVRAATLRHALSTGAATATPVLKLNSGATNTLLYVPVFASARTRGADGTGGDGPVGILSFRLSISAAVDSIIGAFEPGAEGFDTYVLDDSSPQGQRLVHYRPAADSPGKTAPGDEASALTPPFWSASFRFGERDWTVAVHPTAAMVARRVGAAGWYELGAGLALTALFCFYLVSNRIRADRLSRLAETLQREVAVRRSTEETLRLAQRGMDNSSEGITLIDRAGNFLIVNDAACRQLRYTREELLRRTIFDVNPTLDPQVWAERWKYHKESVEAETFESTRIAKDGSPVPVDLTANYFEFNGTEYLFVVARDAAGRRAIEHELRTTRDRAESASQAKSQFLANMSHELRTPLNAIIGFSEVISAALFGPLDARYRDYAQDIHGSGHHLLRIINDLLDLSKIEAGRFELHDATVPLEAIFDTCRRMIAERAAAAGVAIDFAATTLAISGDELRLQQVLLNLVSNAVKFTPAGGRVTVAATLTAAGEAALTVADTGIGMKPEEIPMALQPFGQVDSALSRSHGGTGLGLPLAVRLIELHGGRIAIESEPGRGTTVTMTLPAERTRPAEGLAPTGTDIG